MAIQFHCVACGKPIEVDDSWAGRLVECPYCHDTVTAPAFSSMGVAPAASGPLDEPRRPVAPEYEGSLASPHVPSSMYPYGPAKSSGYSARRGNRVAVVALILACAALMIGLGASIAAASIVISTVGADASQEQMEAFMEEAAKDPPPGLLKAGFAMMGSAGVWLAGLVCGIVGVSREPRGVAIGALCVLAVPALLFILALLISG